jgi:hypothetical protein
MKDPWVHAFDSGERFSSPRTIAGSGSLFAPGTIDCPQMTGTPSTKTSPASGNAANGNVEAECCGTTEWINKFRPVCAPQDGHAHRATNVYTTHCSLDQEEMTRRGVLG